MDNIDVMNKLEEMVDASSMNFVLDTLAMICSEKAEHIIANWQDRTAAQPWQHAAQRINSIVGKVTI